MNTKNSIDNDERSLIELKSRMTEQQRSDMAEIIGNELKRREGLKSQQSQLATKSNVKSSALSGGLSAGDLRDVYESADKNIQELRVKALESRVKEAKREARRLGVVNTTASMIPNIMQRPSFLRFSMPTNKLPVILFAIGIIVLAGMKSIKAQKISNDQKGISENSDSRASLSTEAKKGSSLISEVTTESKVSEQNVDKKSEIFEISAKISGSEAEKAVLMQLDQRRVELERRRVVLDEKEKELIAQAKLVTEKITELKSLTNKLAAMRTEKDSKYSARLDQLASVYGAMAPNEASGLIAKLDEEVALGLLERMPEKRMAQILGVMEQSRAIELTKLLTDRKGL